nr:GNAT family N-acetyltransferase [Sulfobacillus harzensis]
MGISTDALNVVALGSRGDLFIVQPKGSDEVIGFSRLAYVTPDVVLLGGSAVSEGWRGRGIYKTLVAARLRLARQAGAKAALVQAVEDTSAPICRRMGFREVAEYGFYLGNAVFEGMDS